MVVDALHKNFLLSQFTDHKLGVVARCTLHSHDIRLTVAQMWVVGTMKIDEEESRAKLSHCAAKVFLVNGRLGFTFTRSTKR